MDLTQKRPIKWIF